MVEWPVASAAVLVVLSVSEVLSELMASLTLFMNEAMLLSFWIMTLCNVWEGGVGRGE